MKNAMYLFIIACFMISCSPSEEDLLEDVAKNMVGCYTGTFEQRSVDLISDSLVESDTSGVVESYNIITAEIFRDRTRHEVFLDIGNGPFRCTTLDSLEIFKDTVLLYDEPNIGAISSGTSYTFFLNEGRLNTQYSRNTWESDESYNYKRFLTKK